MFSFRLIVSKKKYETTKEPPLFAKGALTLSYIIHQSTNGLDFQKYTLNDFRNPRGF